MDLSFLKANIADQRQLVEQLQRKLGPAWARVVAWLRDQNGLKTVEARIERGDFEGALGGILDATTWFASEMDAARRYSATAASRWMSGALDQLITFDETNHRAVEAAQRARVDVIREVTTQQRAVVRDTLTEGMTRGENPRVVAQDIRTTVGLTQYQAQIVRNFRRELESGQWAAARSRELIDGRWVRTFNRLARDGGQLSRAEITRMVNTYSNNWVAFRAENIARTEGLRAAHVGHHQAFEQAIAAGKLRPEDLVRTWRHGPTRRYSREGHVAMHGQERAWGLPFTNPDTGVSLMHPGDPTAPIGETASCTCAEVIRIRRAA